MMKRFKSGKQRRAEIKSARSLRQARQARSAAAAGWRRPTGCVPVTPGLLSLNNSYGVPDFVARGYYRDIAFRCVDCGAEGVWTAERQRWWYEVAQGELYSTARRCPPCRAKERQRKEAARCSWQAGLVRKAQRLAGATPQQ